MAGVAKLIDGNILNKSNNKVDLNSKKYKGKIIGLYFGGLWCTPCRAFTPLLSEIYKEFHDQKNFEIIFISSDTDVNSFNVYYSHMPWLVLDYNEQTKKDKIIRKLGVTDVPKLILLDGDTGKIICSNAKEQILYLDTDGANFPWR